DTGSGGTRMSTPHDPTELRELLDALVEEAISQEQMRRLEQLVLGSPEAEAYYVQYLSMMADLGRHFAAPAGVERSLARRRGATVILEGPADFRLISADKAYCTRGKLRVTVPSQAQGFMVGSPTMDLIDRGTEFGMRVDPAAPTEVHVFQGKVELYEPGGER